MSSTSKPKTRLLKIAPPPPRVLFVDDVPEVLHSLIRLLPCNVEATVVTSSLRAIRELERKSFALVVADLEMPGLSGADLLILVKERWPNTRRILLTGHTSGALLERAMAYSEATLDKILSREILTDTICRLATEARKP